MCGIAGYANFDDSIGLREEIVSKMIEKLAHRGPDERGVASNSSCVLGNTRLTIIDQAGGHQPMHGADGKTLLVYNGEIYNAAVLRQQLEKRGRTFKGYSDTEVLLQLYEEMGIECLSLLNGMFAFALYDANSQELILARDRFGVKPCVYYHRQGTLVFGSEIKALKVFPDLDWSIDPQAVSIFLSFFFVPDPWTIYKNVRKLPPGSYARFSRQGLKIYKYWDLQFSSKTKLSQVVAQREVVRLFKSSVRQQLTSDVPAATLLSGGLDSKSILAAASMHQPGIPSFTISFAEQSFDEAPAAAEWARLCNSPHEAFRFDQNNLCEHLLEQQKHLDEPYGLWCNTASRSLAKYIRTRGFKVVLGGDGADELFFGYPTVHAANVARYFQCIPKEVRNSLILPIVRRLPAGSSSLPLSFKIKSFVEASHPDPIRNFFGFKEVVRRANREKLLTPEASRYLEDFEGFSVYEQYLDQISNFTLTDKLAYLDFKVFLPSCCLFGADNAYMAESLELRVPFLDNELVEFVSSLPTAVRFNPLKVKTFWRNAVSNNFFEPGDPRTPLVRSYSKKGFEVPAQLWLRGGQFKSLIRNLLSENRIALGGFFRPEAIEEILKEQESGRQNHERLLQAIVSLTLFLEGTYKR